MSPLVLHRIDFFAQVAYLLDQGGVLFLGARRILLSEKLGLAQFRSCSTKPPRIFSGGAGTGEAGVDFCRRAAGGVAVCLHRQIDGSRPWGDPNGVIDRRRRQPGRVVVTVVVQIVRVGYDKAFLRFQLLVLSLLALVEEKESDDDGSDECKTTNDTADDGSDVV